jgi:hypothetical protein
MSTTSAPLTVSGTIHFAQRGRGATKQLRVGPAPASSEPGRVPRVSRLMALAIRFDQLIHEGVVADYAELARLGHVTRARVTQVMNLLHLAPDIQEALLFLPRVEAGRAPIILRHLQTITAVTDWTTQRRMWRKLLARSSVSAVE